MHMKIDQKRLDGILFSIIDKGKLMVISLELSLISKKYILPVRNCFGILEPNAIFRVYFHSFISILMVFLKAQSFRFENPMKSMKLSWKFHSLNFLLNSELAAVHIYSPNSLTSEV